MLEEYKNMHQTQKEGQGEQSNKKQKLVLVSIVWIQKPISKKPLSRAVFRGGQGGHFFDFHQNISEILGFYKLVGLVLELVGWVG